MDLDGTFIHTGCVAGFPYDEMPVHRQAQRAIHMETDTRLHQTDFLVDASRIATRIATKYANSVLFTCVNVVFAG